MNGNEEESSWDSLASDLGLEPAKRPSPPPAPAPSASKKDKPAAPSREEAVEFVPSHVTEIEMKVSSVADIDEPAAFGEGIVEDGADVLDDETPQEAGEEAEGEGDGKGRRRRRRRRRKKGAPENATPVA